MHVVGVVVLALLGDEMSNIVQQGRGDQCIVCVFRFGEGSALQCMFRLRNGFATVLRDAIFRIEGYQYPDRVVDHVYFSDVRQFSRLHAMPNGR